MKHTPIAVRACTAMLTVALCCPAASVAAAEPPTFADVLSLRSLRNVALSPDGKDILFSVQTTDWQENSYDTELWLSADSQAPFQLTRTPKGSSSRGKWPPDGRWVAFLADRGAKSQIHVMRARGGEAQPLTSLEQKISGFEWSPDGRKLAFIAQDETKTQKDREKRYGAFAIEDKEHVASHLWLVDVNPDPWPSPAEYYCVKNDEDQDEETSDETPAGENEAPENSPDRTPESNCLELPEPLRLTEGSAFTISSFDWSPDGESLVYERRDSPDIMSYVSADISILDVATRESRDLVVSPGFDGSPHWSPDGNWILYQSNSGNTESDFYANGHLIKIAATGGELQRLAATHDEQISNPVWTRQGIFFAAWNKTNRKLYRLDPNTDRVDELTNLPAQVLRFSLSADGRKLAFSARTPESLSELYSTPTRKIRPDRITAMTGQIRDWPLGTSEVISWESSDKTIIEGVLHKPADFDPRRKYPLLVVIHGGPTGISAPAPVAGYVYPLYHWVEKGALVLQPNYRGSAGYGEAFRSLNVRNLGVGDMWDVMSGVDHLINQGVVDEERMGAMGWSQGGYISAFLTSNTNRFKAISVGAGISNWMTYYVNTDIHPFTRQYLKGTPWSDPGIYALTSPMTNINQAQTPTLIQHGELDRRVPTPNAYELYQGLQDVGVETELIIYKDFGHGISKPRERLAVVWQTHLG